MKLRKLHSAGLVVLLAGAAARAQVVQYDITDPRGTDLPAKLTFLKPGGKEAAKLDLKSRVPEFAARQNVIYELYGKGEVSLPAGDYQVYISRGPEWSIAVIDLKVTKDRPAAARAVLERVVDTTGYISGDLHLHTKTFSGHGDANVEERLITLCAENLEWAVSTDHNHLTDYKPYARRLGADRWMLTTVGNEVTSRVIGHFNTFPLDPREPPVNWRIIDPRVLFRRMRQNPLDEIIQVNHPRWVGENGGYFRELDLSLSTGDPLNPRFSYDFDSMEVLNDNTLAGWQMRELPNKQDVEFDHSVREDWFNLLNRGYAYTAVGNSDSHEVDKTIGGCPRNYIRSSTDEPSRADERELVRSIRTRQVMVSSGIFVTMTAGGRPLGTTVGARGGEVELEVTVQAAPWVDADRLVIIGNGEPVYSVDLPGPAPGVPLSGPSRPVLRYHGKLRVHPTSDTWYLAYAEGDEPPWPMLHKVTIPLGFTNPIWVDADGDGLFTPLRDLAARAVAPRKGQVRLRPGEVTARLEGTTPAFRRQALAALSSLRAPDRMGPLAELLRDEDLGVRQGAAMALSSLDDRRALNALRQARERTDGRWERFVLDRELVKGGDLSSLDDIRSIYSSAKELELFQMRRDLKELCRKSRIRRWWVAGPFPARSVEDGLAARLPPDREIDYARRYAVGDKRTARWKRVLSDSSHFVNLRAAFEPSERVVGYALVTVHARYPVHTALLLGAKCGLLVRVNGRSVYEQVSARTSSAADKIVPVSFRAGRNSLLVKASVETGEWGFNLMLVDPEGELEVSTDPAPTGKPDLSF